MTDEEGFYRTLFEKTPDALIVSDRPGRIRMANSMAEEVFGYGEGELEGSKIADLVPTQKRDAHEKHREDYYEDPKKRLMGKEWHLEGQKKDGSVFPVEVSLNHFENEGGERLVISSVIDITERIRYQNLKEASIMIEGQERERERVSQELHNGAAQTLTAISLNQQALPENMDPELIADLKQLTDQAIQEVRGLSYRLMPPSLEDHGPLEAIQNMLDRNEKQSGVRLEFDRPDKLDRFPSKIELTLYRVCQEAVNSCIKHAEASSSMRIEIQEKKGEGVHFGIEDEGICINEEDLSFGIDNIRKRVATVEGNVDISFAQGKGTTIKGFLPFKTELLQIDGHG